MCSGVWVGFKVMWGFVMIFFLTAVLCLIAIEIFPFSSNIMLKTLCVLIRVVFKLLMKTIAIFVFKEVDKGMIVGCDLHYAVIGRVDVGWIYTNHRRRI